MILRARRIYAVASIDRASDGTREAIAPVVGALLRHTGQAVAKIMWLQALHIGHAVILVSSTSSSLSPRSPFATPVPAHRRCVRW